MYFYVTHSLFRLMIEIVKILHIYVIYKIEFETEIAKISQIVGALLSFNVYSFSCASINFLKRFMRFRTKRKKKKKKKKNNVHNVIRNSKLEIRKQYNIPRITQLYKCFASYLLLLLFLFLLVIFLLFFFRLV